MPMPILKRYSFIFLIAAGFSFTAFLIEATINDRPKMALFNLAMLAINLFSYWTYTKFIAEKP